MQALILATDEVSKLHPLTEHVPAPLLPVLNRPIMAYPLELLVRAGLRDIGVAVYNKAGCIEAHFATGSRSGAHLTYVLQREALGSAGSLRWAAQALNETFVVLPGDAIVDVDICAALAFHQSHGGIATAVVHAPPANGAPESPYPFQPFAVAAGGQVTAVPGATEPMQAATGSRLFAGTGIYIFEPRIFDWLPPLPPQRAPSGRAPSWRAQLEPMDCYSDLLPELLGGEAVYAYVAEGYWNPIDSAPAYHRAQVDALASAVGAKGQIDGALPAEARTVAVRYVSVEDRELAPGILAGRHVSVHPSARLVAPVYIGAGSQVERDVELGPDVVIGANTIVDEGATVQNSSILEGTYVGRLVKVDRRVVRGGLVVDAGTGDSLRVVDPFLLGDVSPRLISTLLARVADCAAALLLLLLLLPVLALIAATLLLVSLTAGRPGGVLELKPRVRWRRTGEDDVAERETYRVPHFRTRRGDGGDVPAGSFLERTQLNRLPALFSVLKGDLRLVGVMPLDPAEADSLIEGWQRLPYEGPPGFTGLWYVCVPQRHLLEQHLPGQGGNGADIDEIVATDAYYTATRSLREDLYVLLATPVAWLRGFRRSSEGEPVNPAARRPQWTMRHSHGERQLRSLAPAAEDSKD